MMKAKEDTQSFLVINEAKSTESKVLSLIRYSWIYPQLLHYFIFQ